MSSKVYLDKDTVKPSRNSSIELLRMLAIFMVLLVHANYYSLGAPSIQDVKINSIDSFWRIFFEAASIVSVNVFILISGWFGIKPTFKGLFNFLFQCIFFFTGLYLISVLSGFEELSVKGLAGCILVGKHNWFIMSYLLLYILSPVINKFINNTNRKEFRLVLIAYFLFICSYGWMRVANFVCDGYSTIFFIGLYLLARYMRLYSPKLTKYSCKTYFFIYTSITLCVTATIFLVYYIFGKGLPLNLFAYCSPTTIIGALCLILAFTKIELKSKIINWCGISTFAVFLMHFSPSTLHHYKSLFINLHNEVSVFHFWIYTFLILIAIFSISIIIDKLRIYLYNICWNKFFSIIINKFFHCS